MTGTAAPQAVLVMLEKETATVTMTVLESWCVEPTTVVEELIQLWTVVKFKVLKIAILPTMTGAAAPQAIPVAWTKETATLTVSVLETWCVDITTAVVEHTQLWTVVWPPDPCASQCEASFGYSFQLYD